MLVSRASASARRTARRSLGVVAAGLIASTSVLAGCQANPEPPPLASTSTYPSPSESPTDAPPPLPDEARGTSRAAAKAFVRHWIAVLNYAGPQGDGSAIRAISADDCTACAAVADFIDEVHVDGGSITGSGWEVEQLHVISLEPGRSAVLDAYVEVGEQRVRMTSTSKAREFAGGPRLKTFWLSAASSEWEVSRLEQPQ